MEARDLRKLVIAFAKFENENPRPYYRSNEEEREAYQKSLSDFLNTFFDAPKELEIDSIDFATWEKHYLLRAMLMISPKLYQQVDVDFTLKVLENFVLFHTLNKEDNWLRSQSETEYMFLPNMHYFLSEMILYSEDIRISQDVFNQLINPFTDGNYGTETNIIDLYKFTEATLNFCIALISDVVTDRSKKELEEYGLRFWKVWEFVFEKLREKNLHSFNATLLLDNKYLKTQVNWPGFLNKKDLYLKMVTYFGAKNISPAVSVFSTFGETLFLPEGIILLEKLIKENPHNSVYLMDSYGKRLISKLSENHIGTIKMRQDLVNAFIYLLDKMIELESTEAYIIRENVIMYKTS